MKYFVKFFVVTSLLILCTYASAETKVVYMDLKFILNNSKAGKGAQDYLKKTFQDNQKQFKQQEDDLKKEENDLLAKKNILDKEQYRAKTDDLRKKVIDYQTKRRGSIEKITKQRADARQALLEKLDPIINTYIDENNISLVIDKKFTIGGNTNLDITDIIIEKLNKELPSLSIK